MLINIGGFEPALLVAMVLSQVVISSCAASVRKRVDFLTEDAFES